MSLVIKTIRQAALYGPHGLVENSSIITEKMADHINDLFAYGGRSIALGDVEVTTAELLEAIQQADSSDSLVRFGRKLSSADLRALNIVLHFMLFNQIDVLT